MKNPKLTPKNLYALVCLSLSAHQGHLLHPGAKGKPPTMSSCLPASFFPLELRSLRRQLCSFAASDLA